MSCKNRNGTFIFSSNLEDEFIVVWWNQPKLAMNEKDWVFPRSIFIPNQDAQL
jgi:hypothetical protein